MSGIEITDEKLAAMNRAMGDLIGRANLAPRGRDGLRAPATESSLEFASEVVIKDREKIKKEAKEAEKPSEQLGPIASTGVSVAPSGNKS